MSSHRICFTLLIAGLLTGGCDSTPKTETPPAEGLPFTDSPAASITVDVHAPTDAQADAAALDAAIAEVSDLTAEQFGQRYYVPFTSDLGYDPGDAENLSIIQNSRLPLQADELDALQKKGFVILGRQEFPTFTYGYETIYGEDLPLYVSADSILFALHQSYDAMLVAIESDYLRYELIEFLADVRGRLEQQVDAFPARSSYDLDLFLSLAESLLHGTAPSPLFAGNVERAASTFQSIQDADGMADMQLFGALRTVDFSQFKPRGHYTQSAELKQYFRAMMWLGRIDFRLIEISEQGPAFNRRQLEAVVVLAQLIEDTGRHESWRSMDQAIQAFVGEADYLTLNGIDEFRQALGVSTVADLKGKSDQELAQAILDGGYGKQKILSHYMIGTGDELPLNSSFALFGQRYTPDSHVLSAVVHSAVGGRMMPSTFDAAFAAFGNDQAGALLSDEVAKYDYADKLATMRVLLDEHTADFWSANLYTSWLSALRALSPTAERVQEPGVPTVARTEAWGRRLLNTQLASWAELRHNTVLYVKQSYSEGVSCEFPDVYVDPYPEFFAKVAAYADRGQALVEGLTGELEKYRFSRHFEALGSVARELEGMAQQQRDGIPFTQAQMDFINDAVAVEAVCGGEYAEGWYARLFFDPESALEYDPTIVDVHTQPDDEFGNRVGKVLHLGTGNARLMVMTAETCNGPRAYVGVVSSYYEKTTENFERLTDEEWKEQVRGEADVSWLDDVLVGYSDP